MNNAGRGISRPVAELTDDDLDATWTINMKSVVYGIQAVLPHFKEKNAGQIINISSGLSRAPIAPVRAAYGAVKAAVNLLTASLRVELQATHPGSQVTLLLPCVVATEFGLSSLGTGIVDDRKLPGAQPVEGAAPAIVEIIENPSAEAYSSRRSPSWWGGTCASPTPWRARSPRVSASKRPTRAAHDSRELRSRLNSSRSLPLPCGTLRR